MSAGGEQRGWRGGRYEAEFKSTKPGVGVDGGRRSGTNGSPVWRVTFREISWLCDCHLYRIKGHHTVTGKHANVDKPGNWDCAAPWDESLQYLMTQSPLVCTCLKRNEMHRHKRMKDWFLVLQYVYHDRCEVFKSRHLPHPPTRNLKTFSHCSPITNSQILPKITMAGSWELKVKTCHYLHKTWTPQETHTLAASLDESPQYLMTQSHLVFLTENGI